MCVYIISYSMFKKLHIQLKSIQSKTKVQPWSSNPIALHLYLRFIPIFKDAKEFGHLQLSNLSIYTLQNMCCWFKPAAVPTCQFFWWLSWSLGISKILRSAVQLRHFPVWQPVEWKLMFLPHISWHWRNTFYKIYPLMLFFN